MPLVSVRILLSFFLSFYISTDGQVLVDVDKERKEGGFQLVVHTTLYNRHTVPLQNLRSCVQIDNKKVL